MGHEATLQYRGSGISVVPVCLALLEEQKQCCVVPIVSPEHGYLRDVPSVLLAHDWWNIQVACSFQTLC